MAVTKIKLLPLLLFIGGIVIFFVFVTWLNTMIPSIIGSRGVTSSTHILCDSLKVSLPKNWSINKSCGTALKHVAINDPVNLLDIRIDLSVDTAPEVGKTTTPTSYKTLNNSIVLFTTAGTQEGENNILINERVALANSFFLYQERDNKLYKKIHIQDTELTISIQTPPLVGDLVYQQYQTPLIQILESLEQN